MTSRNAIISGAALVNAIELTGKKFADVKIVMNGAGAAGVACAEHYISLGASQNIRLVIPRGSSTRVAKRV